MAYDQLQAWIAIKSTAEDDADYIANDDWKAGKAAGCSTGDNERP